MTDKIPVHNDELPASGIEILSFEGLAESPDIPHRDDHYMFILQRKGLSVWSIDFKECTLEQISLCFVAPGQAHHYLESKNAEGWLIFIEPKLIPGEYRMALDSFVFHQRVIHAGEDHPVFTLADLLQRFITDGGNVFYQSILHSYVHTLTGVFAASLIAEPGMAIKTGNHKYQLVIAFKNLIKQQFREVKQVKDYAAQLNITPLYLNEVTKELTGFIASYWIQKEILLEAQRLLFYTNMDVKEIAFTLGYEDHTYFSRFFKNNLGITASAFRQNNHYLSNHRH
ncbi:AraC-type DNA-binding protein [Chitinophaga rupis]|uniref:AraC-type DNA-binding protein n=1 Tax=Chitinophaga rupis TaxID=573321 RepID=A0A1H7PSJ9_9BACT|nr:helix-turn-helix domain-containing protein [Chitinophaga rupis]SEL38566.1 AraC-type DNA-binding protein [Chitinophaga rupis]